MNGSYDDVNSSDVANITLSTSANADVLNLPSICGIFFSNDFIFKLIQYIVKMMNVLKSGCPLEGGCLGIG